MFIAGGGGFNSAAAWNIGGGKRLWRQQANGDVQAVRFANNNVYFGFHDGFTINGVANNTLRLLAADAASDRNGLVPGFAPASSGSTGVMALDIAAVVPRERRQVPPHGRRRGPGRLRPPRP